MNKLLQYFSYIFKYKEFSNNMNAYSKRQLLDIEQYMIKQDLKVKSKLTEDELAKHYLTYGDCLIIPRKDFNKYITERGKK